MLSTVLVALVGFVLIALTTVFVYRDARAIGLGRPWFWTGLVGLSLTMGLLLYLLVPTVPIPGLLALMLVGPVFYVFERDDTKHSDDSADPHTLPGHETASSNESDDRS